MVVNWEAISAIANILMTLTAFIVIYISLKMNRREREYQRLREKMFFYSALKAGMESTHTDANHFFKYLQVNKEIQHKYPALVERDLYVYLEHIIPAAQSHEEGSFDRVRDMVQEAMMIILRDVSTLQKKYAEF